MSWILVYTLVIALLLEFFCPFIELTPFPHLRGEGRGCEALQKIQISFLSECLLIGLKFSLHACHCNSFIIFQSVCRKSFSSPSRRGKLRKTPQSGSYLNIGLLFWHLLHMLVIALPLQLFSPFIKINPYLLCSWEPPKTQNLILVWQLVNWFQTR